MMLVGKERFAKLSVKKIAVIGLGGVGSFCSEALVRCGISNFILIDKDKITYSNINRQLFATLDNIDKFKVDIAHERFLKINPNIKIKKYNIVINDDNVNLIDKDTHYIIDAIDDLKAKVAIIKYAYKNNIKIISSMGTGNRLNPFLFKITDIYKTKNCPLAKKMRYLLKKENIKELKVLFSEELPLKPDYSCLFDISEKKHVPASISFVPPVAGMLLASYVVNELLKE